jgi:membrane-associated protein
MEAISTLLDFILHINDHLDALVMNYGTAIYGILFLIIFVSSTSSSFWFSIIIKNFK